MQIGFLSSCLRKMPLEEKIIWAAQNQFEALEVVCWPQNSEVDYDSCDINVWELTSEKADLITELCKKHGIVISSLGYYDNNLDCDMQKRDVINRHTMKCIDAADMLGVPSVGTFIGRDVSKSVKDNFHDFETVFGKIVAYAKERNIKIIIENCPMEGWQKMGEPGTISFTPELWAEMFRRIPDENFGLNFDPSHLLIQLIDYTNCIESFKDRIFHVHAKDAEIFDDKLRYFGVYNTQLESPIRHGLGYWRYRMPGKGQLDWSSFITALNNIDYTGVISIEHEDIDYEGSEKKIKEGLLLGKGHLKKLLP